MQSYLNLIHSVYTLLSRWTRRFGLVLTLLCGVNIWADTALPTPYSLAEAAQTARAQDQPLVLLVSTVGCSWCELMRRNYLLPMRKEGLQAYQIEREDHRSAILGWSGKPSSSAQLSQSYAVKVTPTVLFLDAKGNEIAPRLEGVSSVDFVGAYLNQRIEKARLVVIQQNLAERVK